jgi:hypothetical protein
MRWGYRIQAVARYNISVSLLASIRESRVSASRRTASLFILLWIGIIVQPCAMALAGSIEAGCSHCPAEAAAMGGHGDHHDEPAAKPDCSEASAACGELSPASHDRRSAGLEKKPHFPDLLPFAPWVAIDVNDPHLASLQTWADPGVRPGAPPPLYDLFCVYLN